MGGIVLCWGSDIAMKLIWEFLPHHNWSKLLVICYHLLTVLFWASIPAQAVGFLASCFFLKHWENRILVIVLPLAVALHLWLVFRPHL
jgi:hypothetical protein